MTTEHWRHVERLFHDALTFAPEARDAFLARACPDDAALRTSVVQLLEFHIAGDSFLEASPVAGLAAALAGRGRLTGRALGPFRVGKLIGAGGMGEVYEGTDQRIGSSVALKVVTGADPDAQAQASLRREARHAAALSHPHICKTYEVGESEAGAYVAMELIEGDPLGACIPPDGWDPGTVLGLMLQIADAVAHAHRRGIKHGDLKSANVMLTKDQRIKVLDFGLARRLPGSIEHAVSAPSFTDAGAIAGTFTYLAPEVLRGARGDARTDVWALGILLHEMLTGHQPFDGHTPFELTAAILNEEPADLPARIPAGLRIIRDNCLAKNPAQRYADAGGLMADLDAVRAGGRIVRHTRSRKRRLTGRQRVAMAGVALLVLLVVPFGLNLGGVRGRRSGPVVSGRIQSLAVLPLENLSGDPEQDYFADGMTEALITDFGQISSLRVISRTSTMHYKGTHKTLPEIARELRVDAVVEGSVVRSSDRVRVTMQLIEAATETHLWAKSYDRDLRDVPSLQDEVAQAIANEIKVNLTPEERISLASGRSVNNEAHGLYLRGRFLWEKGTQEGLQNSVKYFQDAIAIDPNYAPAYAGLADAYGQLWFLGDLPPAEGISKAKAAAAKALAIDDKLADAHAALGWYLFAFDWDWSAAERELKLAIHLNPSYSTAHRLYTEYLWSQGRFDEAFGEATRALALDPLSLGPSSHIATTFYFWRQYDRAIEQQRKTLELDQNHAYSHANLGESLDQKHMFTEAIAEFQKALAIERNLKYLAWLGHAYAAAVRTNDALRVLSELKAKSNRRYVPSYDVALLYAGLGDKDQAIAWLNRAYEEHSRGLCWIKIEPRLDPLRTDPRFHNLLRRVHLQP